MSHTKKLFHKIFAMIASTLFALQPLVPAISALPTHVNAQESQTTVLETPTPTDTPTETPTPTPEQTIAPTTDASPTPEVTPTPLVEPTLTETPTPSPEPTDTVAPTKTPAPTQSSSEPPHETSPPAQEGQILDGASVTATPTPLAEPDPASQGTLTPSPQPVEHGILAAVVLPNTEAATLDLTVTDPSSATLTTDKADYAPTDTVVITGTGFTAGETYTLIISSTDEPPVTHEAQVMADTNGNLLYAYQLDGNYRPNYKVEVKDLSGNVLATTTFTDDAGIPSSTISATYNSGTGQLNTSGNYSTAPCNDRRVGLALFIDGSDAGTTPGNPLTNNSEALDGASMHVVSDNCTTSGSWVDNNHNSSTNSILSTAPTQVCVAIYDVRLKKGDELTKLNGAIDSSQTGITVDSTAGIVVGNVVQIESEYLKVTAVVDLTTLTVTRGYSSTTPAAHADNKKVEAVIYKDANQTTGAGSNHNNDNSYENNDDSYSQSSCVAPTIVNPTGNLVVHKVFTDQTTHNPVTISLTWEGDWAVGATDENGDATFSGFSTSNIYTAHATEPAGYYESDNNCIEISLVGGQTTECTIYDSPTQGEIVINKLIDADGNLDTTGDQTPGDNWEYTLDGPSNPGELETDDSGATSSGSILTGEYAITENVKPNYHLLAASCTAPAGEGGEENRGTFNEEDGINGVVVNEGETVTCRFINSRDRGTISGMKWNDENGDGEYTCTDEIEPTCEPKLSDWTINLYEDDDGDLGELLGSTQTGENGSYEFTDVLNGWYWVCEVQQDGWEQTAPNFDSSNPNCWEVYMSHGRHGANDGIDFGNHRQQPIITISKTNDAAGDKSPGDSVLFTLVVTATQSAAFNVQVTDLPAGGFTYRPGSWTANSTLRGDLKALLITPQPTYASPGVWQLGDMPVGDVVTLTYIADIASDQKPGLYKDLAWALACKTNADCAAGDSNSVLAFAIDPGFVSENYAGTHINIVLNQQSSGSINVEHQGEVLGAATELPATGADSIWVTLAAFLFVSGIGFFAAGRIMRRYYA